MSTNDLRQFKQNVRVWAQVGGAARACEMVSESDKMATAGEPEKGHLEFIVPFL